MWEAARTQLTYQEKNKQDSKLGTQHRLVQTTDCAAMMKAVECKCGLLKDEEAPSKSLVAAKLEQVEDGAPVAEDLREVTSIEDARQRRTMQSLIRQQPHCGFAREVRDGAFQA